ncbi:MAG: VWA domain-containing protein [Acidobacteriaceae bacterium]
MSTLRAKAAHGFLPGCVLASFFIALSPSPAFSQTIAQNTVPTTNASTEASTTTLSTTVDEVSLDLVVHAKNGKPILDLKPSDMEITDDGTPVKLADMHLVTGTAQTNHLVTFLFDRLDAGPAKTARELAAKIMKAIPPTGYSFAVLEMNGRLRVMQAYTANQDAALKGIADATNANAVATNDMTPAEKQLIGSMQGDALSAEFEDRARGKLLVTALEESQRILEDQHTYPSLAALLALVQSQKQITGRKLVIYFSRGLNANSDVRDTINSVVAQANKAGVVLCAIDTDPMNQQVGDKMMGAMAMAGASGPGAAMSSAAALGSTGYGRGQSGPPIGQVMDAAQNMSSFEFDSMDEVKSPLTKMASGTGGIYIRAGGSTKKPLQQLHEDLSTYYEAEYVPSIKNYNGAFRPIAIHPLRKGLVVETRAGYFALPPDNGSGIRSYEVPLLTILAQPTLPTDVAFQAQVLHLGQMPDGNSGALAVQVPVSALQIHNDGNTHLSEVHLTIVAQIKNDKGAVVQRFSEDIPRHEALDVLHSTAGQYITMERHFSAEPGTYTLETAVTDRISNKSGAQRVPFTIDPIGKGPALSDIAVVREVEPIHEETASFEPMRYMNGRVIPDLSPELAEGSKSLSVFFLVHPMPPSAGQPELSLQIFRNNEPVGTMPLELSKSDGLGAIPYLGNISGHVFPSGNYKVEATLKQGGQTATTSTTFSVEGTIAQQNAPTAISFSATGETETAADAHLTTSAVVGNSKFKIAASGNPVPPPTDAQMHEIIEAARARALGWSETLPNFMCMEVTDHSVDPSGEGDWHHKDTVVQMMRYVDHEESRTTLELNGAKSNVATDDLGFAHSVGEFGGMFLLVFDPRAQAKFTWKEADILDGQPVQVFTFKVAKANSQFDLAGENDRQMVVGFHGTIYLDAATRSVRRISIDADDIPQVLAVRATSISVDYTWVSINNHDFLMPARGAVSLREGKHQAVLNEFEFRGYRRFGSQVRILSTAESKALDKHKNP